MEKNRIGKTLLIILSVLILIGTIMIYSSSFIIAEKKYMDGYYFLRNHILHLLLGIPLLFFVRRIDYQIYQKLIYPIFIINIILLIVVLQIGVEIRGVTRWIKFGSFTFQPSEFAKLSIIIFLAYSISKREDKIKNFLSGFLPNIIIPGIIIALIIKEPDLGTGIFIVLIIYILLFIGGARISHIIPSFIALTPIIYQFIFSVSYRKNRILSLINPWVDAKNTGFQITQSILGFGSGGFFGRGIGCGRGKLFYLPDPHTDFILSVIGEELGFIGVLAVILLFIMFIIIGFRIALMAPDQFGSYLAIGITVLIGLQGLINMGVTLGVLPTKGIPLPFISYGGSSLIINMIAIGILFNISSKII